MIKLNGCIERFIFGFDFWSYMTNMLIRKKTTGLYFCLSFVENGEVYQTGPYQKPNFASQPWFWISKLFHSPQLVCTIVQCEENSQLPRVHNYSCAGPVLSFQSLTWWLTTVCNCNDRGSHAPSAFCRHQACTWSTWTTWLHVVKTHSHIK